MRRSRCGRRTRCASRASRRRRSSDSSRRSRIWTTSRRCTRTSTCRRKSSRPPRVILGIDPGTTGMGYALLDAATDPATILESGIVRAAPEASDAERLVAIATHLDALIAQFTPVCVALERLFFNKNAKTAMRVAEAPGLAPHLAAPPDGAGPADPPTRKKLSA